MGHLVDELTIKLKSIEKKLLKFNIIVKEIKKENSDEFIISKIKYSIKETKIWTNPIYNIFCDNLFILRTNKNEGFLYINEYYKEQIFTCENLNSYQFCQIKCNLINTIIYKEKNIYFEKGESNKKDKEFESESNIKIGSLSKVIYINKIELILFIFDQIINNDKNEKELFDSINQLIKNDNIKIDNFKPPNDTLILNEKIKYNANIKSQAEENIIKINKYISDAILKSNALYEKYEEYQKKININQNLQININKEYSLKKINKDDFKNYNIKLDNINKNIILEYNPIIYYDNDTQKIKCVYKKIKYSKDGFLYDYHKYAELNILSNLNYSTDLQIITEEPSFIKLAQNEFKSNYISKIYLCPKENNNLENKNIQYSFDLVLLKNSNKLFNINCLINIQFSKLYINLSCKEYQLIYDEKEKLFKFKDMEYLLENEEINIKCFSEIGSVDIKPKINLISDKGSNTANRPDLIITNNNILFIIKSNNQNESRLNFRANIFFTNEFCITIMFNTKVKKIDFKLLGYDYNKNKYISEN